MPNKNSRLDEAADSEEAAAEPSELAADPNLISGIYNYCDRWCERCPQTARCLNFKMTQARDAKRGHPIRSDVNNAEFWDELRKNFGLALHLVRQEASKLGVDLDSLESMTVAATMEERSRRRRVASEGLALRRAAAGYRKAAHGLLERLPMELDAIEKMLSTQVRLAAGDPHGVAAVIGDSLEIVSWYLFFIEVKLARAVTSRMGEQADGDDGFPRDSEGSAKVALIAIDRSFSGWMRLREHLTGEQDNILGLLLQLERLRRAVEKEFPQARCFQRAGLD